MVSIIELSKCLCGIVREGKLSLKAFLDTTCKNNEILKYTK